ncbi:hypothetical protein BP5796_04941 [Coleophoma crateriformis]|uniref:Uncharacterized protein n=1 Tax=Coleophoma crateriformis TaxID=565419 RepID=A0A3D8SAZ0_9HELO|nr:hypothetical protein BP5796_04941 [Coleophoma crateriformis]
MSNAVERREESTGCEGTIIDKREADSEGPSATAGEPGNLNKSLEAEPSTLTKFRDGKPDCLRMNPVTQADLPHRSRLRPSAATSEDLSSGDNREGPRIPSIMITLAEEDEDEPQETGDGTGKEHSYSGKGKGKERATDKRPIRSQARYRPRPQPQHRAQSSQQASTLQTQAGTQQGFQNPSENTQSPRPEEPPPLKFNGRYPLEHYSGGPRISPYGAMPVHVRYDGPFMQVLPAMLPYQGQHGGPAQSGSHGMMQSGYVGQQGYQAHFMTPQDVNSSSSYQPDSRTQQRVESIMGPASMGTYQDQRRFEIAAQSASTLQRQVTFPDVNLAGSSPQPARSHPKDQDHVSDPPVRRRAGNSVHPAMMSGGAEREAGASSSNASAARLPSSSLPQRRQASSAPLRHASMPPSAAPLTATSHRPASRSPLHHQTNLQALEEESAEPVMTTLQPMKSMRTMTEEVEGPKLAKKFSIKDLFGRAIGGRKKEERAAAATMEEEE